MYFEYELHASIASGILSTPPNGNIGKEDVTQILPLQIWLLKNSKFKILIFVIIVNMIVIKKN